MFRKIIVSIPRNVHCRQNSNIAFIGLGQMGYRMVNNLVKNGAKPKIYDVSAAAYKNVKGGAIECSSVAEAVDGADVVITMLPNGKIVEETLVGKNGVLENIPKNALIIDSSTIGPKAAQQLYEAAKTSNVRFLDAPVTGAIMGAEKGTLLFIVGGQEKDCNDAKSVLLKMGKNVLYCGEPGSGQTTKLVNNLIFAATMAATAEGLNLGVKMGLDPKLLTDMLNISSGRSFSSDTYNPVPGVMPNVPSTNNYDGGFSVDLYIKDLGLANDVAQGINVPIPMTSLTNQFFKTMSTYGLGKKDFSIIYNFFQGKALERR